MKEHFFDRQNDSTTTVGEKDGPGGKALRHSLLVTERASFRILTQIYQCVLHGMFNQLGAIRSPHDFCCPLSTAQDL